MIRDLMHDPIFLAGKSEDATKEDITVANDLLETLIAHRASCVGMAANMIGVRKRIIAFLDESGRTPTYTVMFNPVIVKRISLTIPKKGVCLCSAANANASAIRPSRFNTRPWRCRLAQRTSRGGQLKSYSTKLTIAMEC